MPPLVERMLDGDPAALREGSEAVESEVRRSDQATGTTALGDTIDAWGEGQLALLRGKKPAGGSR